MKNKYIFGIGNYSMSDDAIGLIIAQQLIPIVKDSPKVYVEAFQSDTINILSYFNEDTSKIVIIDCAKMGCNPGEIRLLSLNEIVSNKDINLIIDTHSFDIISLIELAKNLKLFIPKVIIIAIEPENISFGFEISDKINNVINEVIDLVVKEISYNS